MSRGTVVAVGLCIALVAPFSQAEKVPIRGPAPFTTYDKDKSGGISREEFYSTQEEVMNGPGKGARPLRGTSVSAFDDFDTDNLQLSKAEFAQAQRVQMQPESGRGVGPGIGQVPVQAQGRGAGAIGPRGASFADFDLNSDGQITEQEFNEARAKRIEERAQAGGQMRNLPNAPTFRDLDTNHDGVVTAEEFVAHQVRQRNRAQ